MTALEITGGMLQKNLCFLRYHVPTVPRKVASVPKTTSGSALPISTLLKKHPSVTPGIAAGVKNGKMVSASEKRHWIAPLARLKPWANRVRTT